MKTILIYITLFMGITLSRAQDYFAVVKKNDNLTYNYPASASFTLVDADGSKTTIQKDDAVTVSGDYRLEVVVPWKDTPDIVTSDGGQLEIFILENSWEESQTNTARSTRYTFDATKDYEKPQIEKKTITASTTYPGTYNLVLVFTNGLVFRYVDGIARAYENGHELPIAGAYVVAGTEDTLKLSYNPKNQELWYVFEKTKK